MYRNNSTKFGALKKHASKLLFIMRLTTVILIATMLQVSASSLAQTVTYVRKEVTLVQLFKVIKAQTGYNVVWYEDNLDAGKTINANFRNTPVEDVMDQVLKDQPLSYTMDKQTIVIKEKTPSLFEKIVGRFTATTVTGYVTDSLGNPLVGASVKLQGTNITTRTNEKGFFTVESDKETGILAIAYLGYKKQEVRFEKNYSGSLNVVLKENESALEEVSVVSTGYQSIPKERATGSFVLIDSALLNRKVGANILDRLDGVTSGLLFNKASSGVNLPAISIRGRGTLFSKADPLIVVDNFPYEGDVNNINPNDIASISVLKDAAAASIWGVRAGNGVIVITTKKGKPGERVHISFNANTTISERPNLHYRPQMTSSEYIDIEGYLFRNGYFDNTINDGYSAISPAIAVMLQKRNGTISGLDSARQIDNFKKNDVRNDLEKYIYRPYINQQYSLSLDGGGKNHNYYVSAGYDKNLQNVVANSYRRFTLNANNTYTILNEKLQLTMAVLLTSSNSKGNGDTYTIPYTPYDQLVDANGNHLPVVKETGLRKQFTDTAGKGKLLDWSYRPLDDNSSNNVTKITDYKLNTNAKYNVLKGFDVLVNYQYEKGYSNYDLLYGSNSFYTRNLINSFSHIDPNTLVVTRPVPLGAIDKINNSTYSSSYGRVQMNYVKRIGERHDFNLLAGLEIKDYYASSNANSLYGFNTANASSIPVDYLTTFPQYYGTGIGNIDYGLLQNYSIDRTRSAFFNGAYVYDGKYTLSASARRDESNIFGVKANQKGVPLWSAGLMWNLSNEGFYTFEWIPKLQVRATYGYNGNLDRSTSAYLTAANLGVNSWNAPYSYVINPPNPSLRWEKLRNINIGIDYSSKGNLLSGSIDFYLKHGLDLIGNSPIAPQSGIVQFKGNSADTKTSGIDFMLTKNSTGNGLLKWQSTFLLSYNKELVTDYKVKQGNNLSIVNANYVNPLEGYPYYSIFGFKFMGLDNKGNPQGLLNGTVSENYSGIINSTNASELIYKGSASPLIYGSYRNSFTYRGFNLSLNITYKLNYWFRRTNVFSGSNYSYLNSDYDLRWQKPGDEQRTIIPALTYPVNSAKDAFFKGSEVLVEKADHIRLQDLRISYSFKSYKGITIFKNLQVYTYINNLGILWKATKQPLDPDYSSDSYVAPKSISIGLTTNF